MLQTKFVEKIKTHILYSITFLLVSSDIYEKMWRNILDPNRPKTTIYWIPVACWIPKAKNTHSEYITVT